MRIALCGLIVACSLAPNVSRAQTVRSDRPRLLLSNGTGFGTSAAEFRRRCTSDAAYSSRCQASITAAGDGSYPAIAHAAGYVVNDDAAQCGLAYDALQTVAAAAPGTPDPHSFISDHGRAMLQLAVTLDWCWPALSAAQRQWIIDRIVAYADWYVANGAPDVFHNDMFNVWNAVALAGLALAGTSADAQAGGYLVAAGNQWTNVILPALRYAGDWWHEGMTYVQPSLGSTAWYAAAWSTATDENVFAADADLFEGWLRFHAYALRPDWKYWYFGDTSDNKQSIELFSRWLVDLITNGIRSPLGQALSMEIRDHARAWYDYSGADGWMMALSYDATRDATAAPLESLPTAEWLSRDVQDVAVFRSGWGLEDTAVRIVCGDYMSAHQHDESGSFQIFRHTILTGPTGSYDAYNSDHWQNYYSQHSVHANTLAVVQPGEFFPTLQSIADPAANVNDGGQRVLGLDRGGSTHQVPDLAAYMARKDGGPLYETGSLEHFEHDGCHDYAACDITAAYDSPGFTTNGNSEKVVEVTREFMFLAPDVLLVFDRVEATDPSYDKRFLLHVMGLAEVGTDRYTFTNGAGRLQVQTLLPQVPVVDVVDGFEVEGVPHAPSATGTESGGMRLEISPAVETTRDYFLHLLRATDASDTTWPTAAVTDSAAQVSAVLSLGTRTYTVVFRKGDEPGGYLTARDSASGATCDQYFGAGALPPPEDGGEVSPDGGEPPADGGEPGPDAFEDGSTDVDGGADGGTDDGTGGDDSGGGCGCRAGHVPASAALLVFLVCALSLLRRRRAP